MYFGHISKINRKQYPDAILVALDYLTATDFDKIEAGRYPIKGDLIYAQVLDLETKDKSDVLPEAHRKYLDVQYLHSGEERMGVVPDLGNNPIDQDYDEERDIGFVACDQAYPLLLDGVNFAAFLTGEAHQPNQFAGQEEIVKKCVFKVLLD